MARSEYVWAAPGGAYRPASAFTFLHESSRRDSQKVSKVCSFASRSGPEHREVLGGFIFRRRSARWRTYTPPLLGSGLLEIIERSSMTRPAQAQDRQALLGDVLSQRTELGGCFPFHESGGTPPGCPRRGM